ncbi:MAG: hypothetical protein KatS3mg101_0365 [Patescibacteria group bacterium]|nr:MAG: hypothetical protein KatS3mg101_0365 [Patescibacteria group bacterium]
MKSAYEYQEHTFSENKNQPFEIPPSLEKDTLTLVHEGGHATYALSIGRKIKAYNIAGKVAWVSRLYPEKSNVANAKLTHNEGVVSYETAGMTPIQIQESAAAGAAGELVYFGHIESTAAEQENDRKKGKFNSIWEMQAVAEGLADKFEAGEMAKIYCFVMRRLVANQGFDDINEAIDQGIKPLDFIENIS